MSSLTAPQRQAFPIPTTARKHGLAKPECWSRVANAVGLSRIKLTTPSLGRLVRHIDPTPTCRHCAVWIFGDLDMVQATWTSTVAGGG